MAKAAAIEVDTSDLTDRLPACRICGHRAHWLGDHLVEVHSLSLDAYLTAHPKAPTASADLMDRLKKDKPSSGRRDHPPAVDRLQISFAGIDVRVNHDVAVADCLSLPDHYRIPQYGNLKADIEEASISLACGRSIYIWGLPGSGKDAFFHAWSAMTRTPAKIFQVEPEADIRSWFFSHEIGGDGSYWEEGELLTALRDGYTTSTGRTIPYLILITDFDRATKEQAESLRLVMDSIEGRVKGPHGVTYKVMPGTQVVVTANTAGGGDSRGRMVSANIIDGSILDRFERKYEFHWMDWRDEEVIVKAKFPLLVERCPNVFPQVGHATNALRTAIANDDLYSEFSHRALCGWLGHAQDVISLSGKVPSNLLKRSSRVFLDGMPDEDTRESARHLIDPHLRGGAVDEGDTSHIRKDKLNDQF